MSALPKISEQLFIGRRKKARALIGVPGKVVLVSGTAECVLEDLSCSGAKLSTTASLKPGLRALVIVGAEELFGQIVWGKRGQFGMVFDEPLPVETVIQMRWQADQISQSEVEATMGRIRDWVEGRI